MVPIVVVLFGSEWTLEQRIEPATALHVEAGETSDARPVATYLVPEATAMEQGIILAAADALIFELPAIRSPFELELQGFHRDAFTVEASSDGVAFEPIWAVPASGQRGMRTRLQSFDAPATPLTHLRVRPRGGVDGRRFAGLRVAYTAGKLRHVWLIPLLWGMALAAVALERWTRFGVAARLLRLWQRLDLPLTAVLVVAILFRLTAEVVVIAGGAALAVGVVIVICRGLARSPGPTIAYLIFLYVLFFLFLPWAVSKVAVARAGALYDFTVDHRMRPDGREINADGIRFLGDADDLAEGDFVILQLGDSFTYGLELAYEESYPYVLERRLGERGCTAPVRVVNFGWASSSPLLSLRLLRQIGAEYKPDLLVFNLDMTDFGDDLRYESELRRAGDLELDHGKVFKELIVALAARFPALESVPETLARVLRGEVDEAPARESYPRDRFFATNRSLETSRADIERGVMANLAEIQRFGESELDAPLAVVLYPRHYQYSAAESPRNWEESRYERLGPFALEPFRYFEEVSPTLPYPVFDLLQVFQDTEEFPLFFEDDPHWNAAGARLIAREVEDRLLAAGLVPCSDR